MIHSPLRESGINSRNLTWPVSDMTREGRTARHGHRGENIRRVGEVASLVAQLRPRLTTAG